MIKPSLTILVVDDYSFVLKAIEFILRDKFNLNFYYATDYKKTIDVISLVDVELILLDLKNRQKEDLLFIKKIRQLLPNVKILIFSTYTEKSVMEYYSMNNVNGFLSKSCSEEELIKAIKFVLKGNKYYSLEFKKLSKKVFKKNNIKPLHGLSNREFQISRMIVNGEKNIHISIKLGINKSTISTYKSRIFKKLQIDNIIQLADIINS